MPEFIVRTWERVECCYLVRADDESAARAKIEQPDGSPAIDFDSGDVEQLSHHAFEIDVRSTSEVRFHAAENPTR